MLALLAPGCASSAPAGAAVAPPREDAGSPTAAMAERELGPPDSVERTDARELWGYDLEKVRGRAVSFFHYVGRGHLRDEPGRQQLVVPIRRHDAVREEAFLEAARLRQPLTFAMVRELREHMTPQEVAARLGPAVRTWRDPHCEWWAYDVYNAEFTHYIAFILGFAGEGLVFRPIVPATIYNERIQLLPVAAASAPAPAAATGARLGPDGSLLAPPAATDSPR